MNPDAKPAKVTLRDIARKARVSHVTVARALRNEDCVRLATRERIMALAREMGYTPDPVMSRLMRQIRVPPDHRECEVIGVIDCGLSGHVQKEFQRMFDAVEEQLLHMGYQPVGLRISQKKTVQGLAKVFGVSTMGLWPKALLSGHKSNNVNWLRTWG